VSTSSTNEPATSEPAASEPTASGRDTTGRKRWPPIRAGLIALAILLGLVDGCPLPPDKYTTPMQRPIVDFVRPIQQGFLSPLKWVTHSLRFSQRWALMQAARRDRFRFTVEGRAPDGTWSLLYRANDPDHAAFADILETHHIWGVWNPTDHMMAQYNAFIRWFTAHVLAERPDLTAVRTKQEKIIIADGDFRGTGEFTTVMTRERGPR
jgi:hypothetical protein